MLPQLHALNATKTASPLGSESTQQKWLGRLGGVAGMAAGAAAPWYLNPTDVLDGSPVDLVGNSAAMAGSIPVGGMAGYTAGHMLGSRPANAARTGGAALGGALGAAAPIAAGAGIGGLAGHAANLGLQHIGVDLGAAPEIAGGIAGGAAGVPASPYTGLMGAGLGHAAAEEVVGNGAAPKAKPKPEADKKPDESKKK